MAKDKVPQPGPAKLTKNSGPDEWLKCALSNQYLPEAIMKKLCEMCKELLMEGLFTIPHNWRVVFNVRDLDADIIGRVEHPARCYAGHYLR